MTTGDPGNRTRCRAWNAPCVPGVLQLLRGRDQKDRVRNRNLPGYPVVFGCLRNHVNEAELTNFTMLFMGHLVLGLIAGFILYEVLHDRNVIIFCALGSILPDIVDKPLGYIVLDSVLNSGKIYFHSLIIFLLFVLTGIFVWKYYRSNSFLCVALGIFLHQMADAMWRSPQLWYYPLLGPYQMGDTRNYFFTSLIRELTSPTELIFIFAILILVIIVGIRTYRKQPPVELEEPHALREQRQLFAGLVGIAIFVLILSVIIIYLWQPYQDMMY